MIIRRQACFPFEKWKKLILVLDYKDKNLYYQGVRKRVGKRELDLFYLHLLDREEGACCIN